MSGGLWTQSKLWWTGNEAGVTWEWDWSHLGMRLESLGNETQKSCEMHWTIYYVHAQYTWPHVKLLPVSCPLKHFGTLYNQTAREEPGNVVMLQAPLMELSLVPRAWWPFMDCWAGMAPCREYCPPAAVTCTLLGTALGSIWPVWWIFLRTLHTSCKSDSKSVDKRMYISHDPHWLWSYNWTSHGAGKQDLIWAEMCPALASYPGSSFWGGAWVWGYPAQYGWLCITFRFDSLI